MGNTDNIRAGWLGVAARMQQVACTQNTNAVVTINILVDKSGNPVFWFEPSIAKLEPSARLTDAIEQLVRSRGAL